MFDLCKKFLKNFNVFSIIKKHLVDKFWMYYLLFIVILSFMALKWLINH